MGSKSTPTPPDLTPMSDAQLQISKDQLAQAREQMNMSQAQFDKFVGITNDEMKQSQQQYDTQMGLQSRALDQADKAAAVSKSVADTQISAMDQSMGYAAQDRARYQNTFIPMQDQLIAQAKAYDTPERENQAASQALADNQTQIEAQKANTAAQLASMGVDPSQVMSTSLVNQLGVAGAATGAMNANQARLNTQATGRQMMAGAIDMGNGLPAQSQAGFGTAANAGNVASNATNNATSGYSTASSIGNVASGIRQNSINTASSITGSPMSWANLGNQSYGGASNGIMNASSIQNQMFQNNMSVQNMKNQQSQATMSAIGSAAGMAAMFMAEGGTIPDINNDPLSVGTPSFDMTPSIQDLRPNSVSVVKAPQGMTRDGKIQAGLLGVSAAAGILGANAGDTSGNDPNLGRNWLPPVHRAEGGAMGNGPPPPAGAFDPYGSGGFHMPTGGGFSAGPGNAPPPQTYAPSPRVYAPSPVYSVGNGNAPAPRPYNPAPPAYSVGNGNAPTPQPYMPHPAQIIPEQHFGGGMMRLGGYMGNNGPRPMMFAEGGMPAPEQPQPQSAMGSRYQVMPNVQSRDMIHTMLAPGEVVIPADVARIKGQEFFDKLIAKHHRPGA